MYLFYIVACRPG